MFNNIQAYRLPATFSMTAAALESELAARPFVSCTGMSMRTEGWIAPRGDGQLVYSSGRQLLIALHVEERNIPASVIRRDTKIILDEREQAQGFKPTKAQKSEARSAVLNKLIPNAIAKPRTTLAWLDLENHILAIDASTPNRAEELVDLLRDTLGSLPITAIETVISCQQAMTDWLLAGAAPRHFNLEPDAELRGINSDAGNSETTIRYTGYDLGSKDIKDHIAMGKRATMVGATYDNKITFQLLSPLQIKRIKVLDTSKSADESAGAENASAALTPEMEFEADFLLMTAGNSQLIKSLLETMGGLAEEELVTSGGAQATEAAPGAGQVYDDARQDPLLPHSAALILASDKATISFIQRSLKIGYNRAARLIEAHEEDGLVGPPGAGGVRQVRQPAQPQPQAQAA